MGQDAVLSLQREKLIYFVILRQMEASSPCLKAAYQRLADLASGAAGWDPRTLILDWLEEELRASKQAGDREGDGSAQLLRAAVALASALRQ